MNIVLIGYRCSGKTSVGKIIAGELGREFLDTDVLIEEDAGHSIETLVARSGWDHFREIERRMIAKVAQRDNLVIATGGGAVIQAENVEHLRRNGWVIWLKAEAEILSSRMAAEQMTGRIRPALSGVDPLEEIKEILAFRIPFYEQAAHLVVETTSLPVREVAARILTSLPASCRN